jgi:hypothetical protein
MTLTERIDKIMLESNPKIYGKEKSKPYLKMRQDIFDATSDEQLTLLMKEMEKMLKKKQLDQGELMDLIDKVDQKKKLGGGRVKNTIKGMDKFPNKVRNK